MTKHIKTLTDRIFGKGGFIYTLIGMLVLGFCMGLVYMGKATLTDVGLFLSSVPLFLWMKNGKDGTPPSATLMLVVLLLMSGCATSKTKQSSKSDSTTVTTKSTNIVTETTEKFDTSVIISGVTLKAEGTQQQLDEGDTIIEETPEGVIEIYKDRKSGKIKGESKTTDKTLPITGTRYTKQTAQVEETAKTRVKKQASLKTKKPVVWMTIAMWAFLAFWILLILYLIYRNRKKLLKLCNPLV